MLLLRENNIGAKGGFVNQLINALPTVPKCRGEQSGREPDLPVKQAVFQQSENLAVLMDGQLPNGIQHCAAVGQPAALDEPHDAPRHRLTLCNGGFGGFADAFRRGAMHKSQSNPDRSCP